MTNPIISIIVPCYNAEKYVHETLDCLQRQTIDNWECVIVNDGSTDGSLEILREYEQIDPRYKVIDSENGGPAAARNKAIAASSGKYILPLDADDLIDPTYAEKAIKYLEEHPQTKLVYCKARYFGTVNKYWELEDYEYNKMLWGNYIFCSAVYRRSDYDKTYGYNENMRGGNEDWDFWLSLLHKDDIVYRIPEYLFFYRQHTVSRNTIAVENSFSLVHQMIMNHIELYEGHEKELVVYYKNNYDGIKNSSAYKVGKLIVELAKKILKILGLK